MINIALGFDKKFSKYACVTIKSILHNNKSRMKFYLMIDNTVPIFYKIYIRNMIKSTNNEVLFIDMSSKFKNQFAGTWSKAMYYPILLSSICNDDRILFLDSDVIVNGDLNEFYSTDLTNLQCAGVQDYGMKSWIKQKYQISISNNNNEKIGIDEYFSQIRQWNKDDISRYFNSGVLLLNLDEMRKNNSEEKMLQIITDEKLACPDQDCFNICFHNSIKIMPMKYNFMVVGNDIFRDLEEEDKKRYAETILLYEIPVLIHFLNKPWLGDIEKIPFAYLYEKYKNMTILKYLKGKSKKKIVRFRIAREEMYLYLFGKKIFSKRFIKKEF